LTRKKNNEGGETGKNNSVNLKKSKNKKFEILIIGLFNYFIQVAYYSERVQLSFLYVAHQ